MKRPKVFLFSWLFSWTMVGLAWLLAAPSASSALERGTWWWRGVPEDANRRARAVAVE